MYDQAPPLPPREIVPQTPILSKQTYASPMSFVGATKRILTWADKPRSTGLAITVWTAVVLGLVIVWALLVCWYVVIFGLFGIFTFPYRLIRRSQRKSQHVQRVQLATMQTMMAGQMNDPGNSGQTRDGRSDEQAQDTSGHRP